MTIDADEYKPPTDEEIWSYWNSLSKEQQIEEIRKLDIIENYIPDIILPDFATIVSENGDLVLYPLNKMNIKISYLEYDVETPHYVVDDFCVKGKNGFWDYFFSMVFGAGIGVIGTALSEKAQLWQYGVSFASGAVLGLLFTLMF